MIPYYFIAFVIFLLPHTNGQFPGLGQLGQNKNGGIPDLLGIFGQGGGGGGAGNPTNLLNFNGIIKSITKGMGEGFSSFSEGPGSFDLLSLFKGASPGIGGGGRPNPRSGSRSGLASIDQGRLQEIVLELEGKCESGQLKKIMNELPPSQIEQVMMGLINEGANGYTARQLTKECSGTGGNDNRGRRGGRGNRGRATDSPCEITREMIAELEYDYGEDFPESVKEHIKAGNTESLLSFAEQEEWNIPDRTLLKFFRAYSDLC